MLVFSTDQVKGSLLRQIDRKKRKRVQRNQDPMTIYGQNVGKSIRAWRAEHYAN